MKNMLKDKIQVLADFLGKRDIPQLKKEELQKKYCFEKADVFVLFGGSIIEGAKVFAQAKQNDA
ncbi:MAG: YdcF family protein, partial [Christensenellaceae bacterium]|nr:YdcF family protein [Christensenellaceae bacterium]